MSAQSYTSYGTSPASQLSAGVTSIAEAPPLLCSTSRKFHRRGWVDFDANGFTSNDKSCHAPRISLSQAGLMTADASRAQLQFACTRTRPSADPYG